MTVRKFFLMALSCLHIFVHAETVQVNVFGAPAREIKIPAKFICTPKIGAALVKSFESPDWLVKEVQPSVNDSFMLTIDRYENFQGVERENCETAEVSNNEVNDVVYKLVKAQGKKLCAARHYHLVPKSAKLSSACQVTATKEYSGVYCNDFTLNITERYYVDIPTSMFILPLGRVVMSQGTCLPIP